MKQYLETEEMLDEEMMAPAAIYYYAFLDENDIVQGVYPLPSIIEDRYYIRVDSDDQSLIGKWYNRQTGEFVDRIFYAVLNQKDVVVELANSATPINEPNYILIESYDMSLIGKWYNRTTGTFEEAPIHVLAAHSTGEINIEGEDKWLTSHLVDYQNPHKVTKGLVGLGNVDNTSDLNKPISNATRTEIERIKSEINQVGKSALIRADYSSRRYYVIEASGTRKDVDVLYDDDRDFIINDLNMIQNKNGDTCFVIPSGVSIIQLSYDLYSSWDPGRSGWQEAEIFSILFAHHRDRSGNLKRSYTLYDYSIAVPEAADASYSGMNSSGPIPVAQGDEFTFELRAASFERGTMTANLRGLGITIIK